MFVDYDFNEATPGWDVTHFDKIQNGIGAVGENGTVIVYNGFYYENIIIDKTINLSGENRYYTRIDGNGVNNVVSLYANSVRLSGFKIRNVLTSLQG